MSFDYTKLTVNTDPSMFEGAERQIPPYKTPATGTRHRRFDFQIRDGRNDTGPGMTLEMLESAGPIQSIAQGALSEAQFFPTNCGSPVMGMAQLPRSPLN